MTTVTNTAGDSAESADAGSPPGRPLRRRPHTFREKWVGSAPSGGYLPLGDGPQPFAQRLDVRAGAEDLLVGTAAGGDAGAERLPAVGGEGQALAASVGWVRRPGEVPG